MKLKTTFLNLSKERQNQILEVSFLEFTQNNYTSASVTTIVKKLGLAKGSFYRYFSSKMELYLYLLHFSSNIRYSEIKNLTDKFPESFEELLIENFQMKIQFDKKYPIYSGFLYRVILETNNSETSEIVRKIKLQLLEKTKQILQKYIGVGKLKVNLNLSTVAFTIMQIQIGVYDYLALNNNIDFLENVEKGKPVFNLEEDEVIRVVTEFAKIICVGIKK